MDTKINVQKAVASLRVDHNIQSKVKTASLAGRGGTPVICYLKVRDEKDHGSSLAQAKS
jgi:hypothetical protein